MPDTLTRGNTTRHANMALRRNRILDTAREIIARSGYDALSVRELARRADVTVPTIYNLIGNKSAVLEQLFDESVSPFEDLQYIASDDDPVASPERFFAAFIASIRDRENYHRAEFLAREHLRASGDAMARSIDARIRHIAIDACQQAHDAGLLTGNLSSVQLGEQIDHQVRLAFHDWAHGAIDLTGLERRLIVGTYLCFAADATAAYHPLIVEKLRNYDTDASVVQLNNS